MKTITRESYAKRIERVSEYLIDHLDTEINLHRLAEEANLSAYHFHRIYHGMVGETIKETVKRMRLHRAAVQLISTRLAIVTVATQAGYSTIQAFNRAFSQAYLMPPARYRELQSRMASNPRTLSLEERRLFTVTIKQVEPLRVVALRHCGDYMQLGNAFERLAIWAASLGINAATTASYGIYYDDPAGVPMELLRSDACIAVPASVTPIAPYRAIESPGGRCAVLVCKGPYSSLEKPYKWLFGEWLPQSGEEPADLPSFEQYLNDARTTQPSELLTAIC